MHFVAFAPTRNCTPGREYFVEPGPGRDRTRERMPTPKKWTVQLRPLQKACPGRLQCFAIHATAKCNSLHPGAPSSVLKNLLCAWHIRVTHLAFRTSLAHRTSKITSKPQSGLSGAFYCWAAITAGAQPSSPQSMTTFPLRGLTNLARVASNSCSSVANG